MIKQLFWTLLAFALGLAGVAFARVMGEKVDDPFVVPVRAVVLGVDGKQLSVGPGRAYQREMELLVECGLTPREAIVAATKENAEFFRVSKDLGTVEPGKLADLVLVATDPSKDIQALRNVRRVMLNGQWVAPPDQLSAKEKSP